MIACTLVSVRYFNPAQAARAGNQIQSPTVAGAGPIAAAPVAPAASTALPANNTAVPPSENLALAPLSANLPERAAELTPWSAPAPADRIPEASIAGNVSRLDPEFDQTGINGRFFATTARQQAPNVTTAELTSVTAVTSKRSRLLAQFGERYYAPEPQAPKIVRERLTRQLADTDFNDRFSRIGLKGDQVSLKF